MEKKVNPSFILSLCIFVVLIIVLGITTQGKVFQKTNLIAIFNQSLNTIVAGLGMIFVVAMGETDITTGVVMALAGTFAAIAGQVSLLLVFPVAILVGAVMGSIIGISNAKFKVPSFMVSLAILIGGRALVNLMLKNTVVFASPFILQFNKNSVKIPFLIILLIIIIYLFEYTPFGYYVKAIGENEVSVRYMGISVTKIKYLAFVISGIMFGLAGVLSIARTGGASNTMATGMEMNVLMAIFIGGNPINGGLNTRIYKLLMGVPMVTLLVNGLVLSGTSGPITQGVKGFALLFVVFITILFNKKINSNNGNKSKENKLKKVA